jgi:Ras-related protein Rab-2A
VAQDEGEAFARINGLYFIETSAKDCSNVTEAFMNMIEIVFQKLEHNTIPLHEVVFFPFLNS